MSRSNYTNHNQRAVRKSMSQETSDVFTKTVNKIVSIISAKNANLTPDVLHPITFKMVTK